MAQATLVGQQIDDGPKLLTALTHAGFDVTAACWIKTSEDTPWYLYIASKDVDANGITAAYGKLLAVLRGIPDLWVDPFEVKLIGAAHPITQDLIKIVHGRRGKRPIRYGGARLGGSGIEEAFIYPTLSTP